MTRRAPSTGVVTYPTGELTLPSPAPVCLPATPSSRPRLAILDGGDVRSQRLVRARAVERRAPTDAAPQEGWSSAATRPCAGLRPPASSTPAGDRTPQDDRRDTCRRRLLT